jgi:hypothetical protein
MIFLFMDSVAEDEIRRGAGLSSTDWDKRPSSLDNQMGRPIPASQHIYIGVI